VAAGAALWQPLATQHGHQAAARLKPMSPAVAEESADPPAAATERRPGNRPLASHRNAECQKHDHNSQRDQGLDKHDEPP